MFYFVKASPMKKYCNLTPAVAKVNTIYYCPAQPLHLHLPNKYKSKLKDAKNSIN